MVAPPAPHPPCTCAPSQLPKQTQAARLRQIFKAGRQPRATATAAPGPRPRTPRLSARVTAPVDALWQPPARQRGPAVFSAVVTRFSRRRVPPDPGLGAAKAASARVAPGGARRRGKGRGLREAQYRESVPPGQRGGKQDERPPLRARAPRRQGWQRPQGSKEAARAPRAARLRHGLGLGPGPGQAPAAGAQAAPGSGLGQGRARPGRLVAPGPRTGAQTAVITWPV